MKIFCVVTESHEVLLDHFFKPSIPRDFQLEIYSAPQKGNGNAMEADWLDCLLFKVKCIQDSIERNPGEILIWSDIDIQLFNLTPERVRNEFVGNDSTILFQRLTRKRPEVCGGFYFLRATDEAAAFFREVYKVAQTETSGHDQDAMNLLLLQRNFPIKWGLLPHQYYARTHGFPPPADIAIYHATSISLTNHVGDKIDQLKEIQWMMANPGPRRSTLFLKNLPGAIVRRLRAYFAR